MAKVAKRKPAKTGPTRSRAQAQQDAQFADLGDQFDQLGAQLDGLAAESGVTVDGEIVPVELGQTGLAAEDVEMVHIFSLDGEKFSIPKNPNPMLLIRFLRQTQDRKIGITGATGNLLYSLLGEEAMDALADSPQVSRQDIARVMDIVTKVGFDALSRMIRDGLKGDGPLGNS